MSVPGELARPAGPADAHRSRLVTTGSAGMGAVLLVAFAIVATRGREQTPMVRLTDGTWVLDASVRPALAPYIVEYGLRAGTIFGVCLLVVPFLVFTLLALRTGTAARERRLAALCLAGATRSQLRAVAAREGTRAAVRGALLAGPLYLVLWLLLGVALPFGWRLVPAPGWLLAGVWLVLIAVLAGFGAAAAVLASDVVRVSPLGVARRVRRPLGPRDTWLPLLSALTIAGAVAAWLISDSYTVQSGALYAGVLGVLGLALTGGNWLIQLIALRSLGGGIGSMGGGVVGMLAGRRLLADVRTPGRVAGVLMTCGFTVAVVGAVIPATLNDPASHDYRFFVVGALAAGVAGLIVALVGCGALAMTASEQVLDGRRGIAVLVSLAASPALVQRVVRRQLLLAAVPPTLIGAVLGLLLYVPLNRYALPWALLALPLAAGISWAGATLAARGVRATVLDCASPDNLRAS